MIEELHVNLFRAKLCQIVLCYKLSGEIILIPQTARFVTRHLPTHRFTSLLLPLPTIRMRCRKRRRLARHRSKTREIPFDKLILFILLVVCSGCLEARIDG